MLLLYLIVFVIFYSASKVKNKPTFKVIILLYLTSIICACVLWYFFPEATRKYPLYFPGIIYHIIVLVVMMMPLRRYDRILAPEKISLSYKTLRPFMIGLVVLSLISIVSSFYTYSIILSSGVSILEGRVMSFQGESFMRIVKPSGSILAHISTIASEFSYLALFFAFYIAVKFPSHKRMIIALLISSLTAVFFQLEWFGRENIVRYFLDGAIVLVLFTPLLSNSFKKKIKRSIVIITFLFGGMFAAITLGRFGEDTGYEEGPVYSVLSYLGQGFYNFSPIFRAYNGFEGRTNGKTIFAIFYDEAERGSVYNTAASYSGPIDIPHNVFGTYVCSFVSDLGAIPAIIPFVFLTIFFLMVSHMKPDNIFTYIYVLWIYRFFTQGVFYWVDNLVTGDRILCFMLVFFLHFLYSIRKRKYRIPQYSNIST